MNTYSKAIVVGHLAADARYVESKNGTRIADFTVAVNDAYRRDEEVVQNTVYIDWTAFGGFADYVKALPVGAALLLEGRVANEKWTDRFEQRRLKMKMVVERLKLLAKPVAATEPAAASPNDDATRGQGGDA